ncbi:MAG: TMEM14 family protein [Pleurocapsa sp.]
MNLVAMLATIAYGLLSGLGGIWGYMKSKSKPSLISGCLSAILLLIAAGIQSRGYSSGLVMSRIIILLLLAVFTIRLIRTGKFMPSGIMLIAGVIALSCTFI